MTTNKDNIVKSTSIKELEEQTLPELRKHAAELLIKNSQDFKKTS